MDAAQAGEIVPFTTIHLRRLLAREITRVNSLLSSSVNENSKDSQKDLLEELTKFNYGQSFVDSNSASPDFHHRFFNEEVFEAPNIGMKILKDHK